MRPKLWIWVYPVNKNVLRLHVTMNGTLLMQRIQGGQELFHYENDFTHLEARLLEHVFFESA